jgi:hypothetical protein
MIWRHWTMRLFTGVAAAVYVTAHGGYAAGIVVALLVVMYEARLPHE